jgi:hypothetical protein
MNCWLFFRRCSLCSGLANDAIHLPRTLGACSQSIVCGIGPYGQVIAGVIRIQQAVEN